MSYALAAPVGEPAVAPRSHRPAADLAPLERHALIPTTQQTGLKPVLRT